jgi:hypothetical protein
MAVGVAVVVIGKRGHPATPGPARGVNALTPLTPGQGKLAYADGFSDAGSGWFTGAYPSGTTASYGPGGYVIVGQGFLDHFFDAPYYQPIAQVSIMATGAQDAGALSGAGFGVTCRRGYGSAQLRYQFLLLSPFHWEIDRGDGPDTVPSVRVEGGRSSVDPTGGPATVTGVCASIGDGSVTRLAMFINGVQVANTTDDLRRLSPIPEGSWLTGIAVSSVAAKKSRVVLTRFELRDLAASRDRSDDEQRLLAGRHLLRKRIVRGGIGPVLLAGKEPKHRTAALGLRVANGSAQRWMIHLEHVQHRALRHRRRHLELNLAANAGQRLQVGRQVHPDQSSVCTSTESTPGRSWTMGAHESPASFEAYT